MPGIVQLVGDWITEMLEVALLLPQVLERVYDTVTEPTAMPLTTPLVLMLANVGTEELHVPPLVALNSEIVLPEHTVAGPEIAAGADGAVLTVTDRVATAVPQLLVLE
jgi:hypothetical protein